jgi:tetratricopeptide (TPR) repeat protein
MYSDKPIRETHYRTGQDFLEVCPFFDREFFHFKTDNFFGHNEHPSYFGGLRCRVFGGGEPGKDERYFYCINKLPLIKYDQSFVLSDNLHWTNCKEIGAETGCLLHFKYFSSFPDYARQEAERKEHWNSALQYTQYSRAIEANPGLNLFSAEHSIRFRGSRQLLELGIMRANGRPATAPNGVQPDRLSSTSRRESADSSRPNSPQTRQTLLRQLRDLVRAHKTDAEHPHENGIALFKEGNLEGAAAAFRRAVELHPDFSWSHHNLGEVLLIQEKWHEALAAFQRAIQLNPHFALSYSNLGDVLMKQGKREEAVAAYRRAFELEPALMMTTKSLTRPLAGFAQAHVTEPGRWYGRAHAVDSTAAAYTAAVALRPIDPELCIQLADALVVRSQSAKAIFFYQVALMVSPDYSLALVKLARALRLEGELQQAIACCRRAIAFDPNQSTYHRLLGDLLADLGQILEATATYRRASELEPDNAELIQRLGDLLAQQGRGDEASVTYQRAMKLGHKNF